MNRFLQQAYHLGERIVREGKALPMRWRVFGAKVALAAGRPVLPIIYSDKTLHVLQDLGFDGVMYDIRKEGAWTAVEGSITHLSSTKSDAQRHFEKLDAVLSS